MDVYKVCMPCNLSQYDIVEQEAIDILRIYLVNGHNLFSLLAKSWILIRYVYLL